MILNTLLSKLASNGISESIPGDWATFTIKQKKAWLENNAQHDLEEAQKDKIIKIIDHNLCDIQRDLMELLRGIKYALCEAASDSKLPSDMNELSLVDLLEQYPLPNE